MLVKFVLIFDIRGKSKRHLASGFQNVLLFVARKKRPVETGRF